MKPKLLGWEQEYYEKFTVEASLPTKRGFIMGSKLAEVQPYKIKDFISSLLDQQKEAIVEMVESHWTFNKEQGHTHTWHDKADALAKIRKEI